MYKRSLLALLVLASVAGCASTKVQNPVNYITFRDEPLVRNVEKGMSKDEVLRILGPSYPGWTVYFKARDELVWEWRFCDVYSEPARFDVLFDGSTGKVRSTMSMTERLSLPWGRGNRRDWCSR